VLRNRFETIIGCASVSIRDSGHFAANLWDRQWRTNPASLEWQVAPRMPLPVQELQRRGLNVEVPPVIKGDFRRGARLLGAPAWDPDFNRADLPLPLRIDDLPKRYRRQFLGE